MGITTRCLAAASVTHAIARHTSHTQACRQLVGLVPPPPTAPSVYAPLSPALGKSAFQLRGGGGGPIEPPKTGGVGGWEKGEVDRTINQL